MITKDPLFVEAGRRGARKRWGEQPRIVRLDDMTPSQRALVVALIDALKTNSIEKVANDAA